MTKETWVTTVDNPFDPFSQFEAWKRFDEDNGYYTTSYICRILKTYDDMSEEAYRKQLEEAVDEIVNMNVLGIYRKVVND